MKITITVEVPGLNDPDSQEGQDLFDALALDAARMEEEWADLGLKATVAAEQTQM